MGPTAEIYLIIQKLKKKEKQKGRKKCPVTGDLSGLFLLTKKVEGEVSETWSQISLRISELVLLRREKYWHVA